MSGTFIYEPSDFELAFDEAFNSWIANHQASAHKGVEESESRSSAGFRPRIDVYESSDRRTIVITFELPGIPRDCINVDMDENFLTVSGCIPTPTDVHGDYMLKERRSGRFSRSISLPIGVKPQSVKASLCDGILSVTFPNPRC